VCTLAFWALVVLIGTYCSIARLVNLLLRDTSQPSHRRSNDHYRGCPEKSERCCSSSRRHRDGRTATATAAATAATAAGSTFEGFEVGGVGARNSLGTSGAVGVTGSGAETVGAVFLLHVSAGPFHAGLRSRAADAAVGAVGGPARVIGRTRAIARLVEQVQAPRPVRGAASGDVGAHGRIHSTTEISEAARSCRAILGSDGAVAQERREKRNDGGKGKEERYHGCVVDAVRRRVFLLVLSTKERLQMNYLSIMQQKWIGSRRKNDDPSIC